jgi:hypothetical protein
LNTRTPGCEGARLRASYPAALEGDDAGVDGVDGVDFDSDAFEPDGFDSEGLDSEDFDSEDFDSDPLFSEDFDVARESLR